MPKFRYFTRTGEIVSSSDVDIILKEDNGLLIANKGGFFTPKLYYARREQGLIIEKNQEISLKDLPNLLVEYEYLPVYYIGFSKSNMLRLQKAVSKIKRLREQQEDSIDERYNDFIRDLKHKRELWLIKEASVNKSQISFDSKLENKSIVLIDKDDDINDIIDSALSNPSLKNKESFDDDLIPIKKKKGTLK